MSKKVLIGTPTGELKDYAFDRFMENVSQFTYQNADFHIVDNSESRDYLERIKRDYGHMVTCERVSPQQYKSFKHALAKSHDRLREKALQGGYDYLFHLESDIFPPADVIERLLSHKKPIVGGLYHIEHGAESKLMIQKVENFGNKHRETYNLDLTDLSFADGSLKPVFSCGLGCAMIDVRVFEKLKDGFRFEGDGSVHPDSIFYGDVHHAGIRVYADTSIYCEHENKSMIRT